MTPQERQLIDDLFDKLVRLEGTPRDADAMAAIVQNLRRAPHAVYALVQTVLVQDEALKRANNRIQTLEGGGTAADQQQPGGFLDTMRDAIFGQSSPSRGSVPQAGARPAWNTGQALGQTGDRYAPQPYGQQPYGQSYAPTQGGGGSFLGTAAAAAAGVVGGGLLMSSIRGMMGGGGHQSFGDSSGFGSDRGNPWSGGSSNNELSRDAGINDIGSSGDRFASESDSRSGLFDTASDDSDSFDTDNDFGGDSDFGGDDSDTA